MNYGVPYKGSKNKIAEWVCEQFPKADNFYDLFAGGCAVTHRALFSQKFQNFYVNDLWTAPQLFLDAINGKYKNETRWISREEFFSERLKNPYIQFCWSFGNNGRDYLYSKEIEEWKKALHYARIFNDNSIFEKFGINTDGSSADIRKHHEEYKKLYIKWYVKNLLKSDLKLQNLQRLQSLERLQSLQSLQRLQRLQSLHVMQGDYRNVPIKHNSVIYCDIPYRNTNKYNFSDENGFDYNAFYKWCSKQKELVIVSEYNMPDDFICIAQKEKHCSLNGGNGKIRIEKLFVPKHQAEMIEKVQEQKLLF